MAADLNHVSLIGRLTRDIELRDTRGGSVVGSIRLAFTTRRKDGNDWVDKSNYVDVTVFGALAENAEKYLSRGSQCAIDGVLDFQEWEDRETQQKRSRLQVIANSIQFLGSPPDRDNDTRSRSTSDRDDRPRDRDRNDDRGREPARQSPRQARDDDIPF